MQTRRLKAHQGYAFHTGMNRLAHIDGLRAVAILSVLLFHLGFTTFSGGFVGVDVFFVISGFVITRMIVRDLDADRFNLIEFFFGRITRLIPALIVTILATGVGAWLLMTPTEVQEFTQSAVAALLGWSNILFWIQAEQFETATHAKPMLHTWMMSIQWQFYLIWAPLVLALRSLPKRIAPVLIVYIAVVSFALNLDWEAEPTTTFYWMPFRIFEFAIGALLIWMPSVGNRYAREGMFVAGIALLAYAALGYDSRTPFPSYHALVPAIGAALVIAGGALTSTGCLLDNPLAAWLGRTSYSTYLVHWPLIVLYSYLVQRALNIEEALVIAGASIGLGAALHYSVEVPFSRGRLSRRGLAVFAIAAAVVALWLPAVKARETGWIWPLLPEALEADASQKVNLDELWGRSGCMKPCGYGNTSTGKRLVLVMGDSQVDHYARTLEQIGGVDTHFLHLHGDRCYFGAKLKRHSKDPTTDGCITMNEKKMEWLSKSNLDAVIHAQRWPGYADTLETQGGTSLRFDSDVDVYRAQLADIENLYADFDGRVVLLNFVPSGNFSCLPFPQFFLTGCGSTDMSDSREFRELAENMVARHPAKFVFLDPADYLCSGVRCMMMDENRRPMFVDDFGHISVYAAERIVPAILAALVRPSPMNNHAKPQ